jgi:hypothetical protein
MYGGEKNNRNGMMEWWNNGMVGKCIQPRRHETTKKSSSSFVFRVFLFFVLS